MPPDIKFYSAPAETNSSHPEISGFLTFALFGGWKKKHIPQMVVKNGDLLW